jgi:hypothetical protein
MNAAFVNVIGPDPHNEQLTKANDQDVQDEIEVQLP